MPSNQPSNDPSSQPSQPSSYPTKIPRTLKSSQSPSYKPSYLPYSNSITPSIQPSAQLSIIPSIQSLNNPTFKPTAIVQNSFSSCKALQNNIKYFNREYTITINGISQTSAVVTTGATVTVNYYISGWGGCPSSGCCGCLFQLNLGIVGDSSNFACESFSMSSQQSISLSITRTFSTPGCYVVAVGSDYQYSCISQAYFCANCTIPNPAIIFVSPPSTKQPSNQPTKPTIKPSVVPTTSPTDTPSDSPTALPTYTPTASPTYTPTYTLTAHPSFIPSSMPPKPTESPTYMPSNLEISFGDGCKICQSGLFCYANICSPCPINNFCPTGSYAYKCPPDLIAPKTGLTSCYRAPTTGPTPSVDRSILGKSCDGGCKHGTCYDCVPGSYCPNGLYSYICPKNLTSIMGSSQCNIVADGSKGVTTIKNSTILEIPFYELDALRSIYISLNGLFWQIPSSHTLWDFTSKSSYKPCSNKWIGLNCSCVYSSNTYKCNIVGINLNGLGLSGKFSAFFGSFQLISNLNIGNNYIFGSIPNELNFIKTLVVLDISNNYISGTIPNFEGSVNLKGLYLQDNFLQGNLPNFSTLSKLEYNLNVSVNFIDGLIPVFTGLNFLTNFDSSYNSLSGIIPSFGSNYNLQTLALQNNQLIGSIPSLNMPNLIYINLVGNNLIGSIPPNIGNRNITQFIYLGLSTVDSKSTCYPSCLYVSLNADYFSSSIRCPGIEDRAICGLIQSVGITKNIGGSKTGVTTYHDSSHPLTKSQYFSFNDPKVNKYEITLLGRCGIENYRTIDICSNSPSCVQLTCGNTTTVVVSDSSFVVNYTQSSVDKKYRGFTFSVTSYAKSSVLSCLSPPSFSSDEVSHLQLSNNDQTVSNYASKVCSWSQVKCLHGQVISLTLRGLGLNGYISDSISLLTSLRTLDLGANSLYGTIPNSLGLLKNLIILDLSDNKLNGTVPIEITTLPKLTHLILSKNFLSGSIIQNISSSLVSVDLSNNFLHGQVPASLGSFKSTKFNFQGNVLVPCFQPNPNSGNVQLTSSLPECIPTNSPTQLPTPYIESPASPTIPTVLIGSIVGPVGFVLVLLGLYFYRRQRLKFQADNELKQAKKERLDSLPIHKALIEFYDLRSNFKGVEDFNNNNIYTDNKDECNRFPETVVPHQDNHFQKQKNIKISHRILSTMTGTRSGEDIVLKAIKENIKSINEMDYNGDSAIDICFKNYEIAEKVTDCMFIYKILRETILSDIDDFGNLTVSQTSIYGPIWIKVTNSTLNLTDVVERILNEFPKHSQNLANTCDHVGRTVLQLAVPEVTRLIIQSINLFKRYDINKQPHHKSATCSIHLGSDYEDGITGNAKVALKFMSNKEQFLSEINAREIAKFDKQYVVGVVNKFDSDQDEFVRSQLETFGFSQYPYVLVMPQCNRDLDEIISKELDKATATNTISQRHIFFFKSDGWVG